MIKSKGCNYLYKYSLYCIQEHGSSAIICSIYLRMKHNIHLRLTLQILRLCLGLLSLYLCRTQPRQYYFIDAIGDERCFGGRGLQIGWLGYKLLQPGMSSQVLLCDLGRMIKRKWPTAQLAWLGMMRRIERREEHDYV